MKLYRYPTKRQHTKKGTRFVVNIHINGAHAIRVIQKYEGQADELASQIMAYLKLVQRKANIDESRRNQE